MKNYIAFRCVLGLIGSVVAAIAGIAFLSAGISDADSNGILIGIPVIIVSIIGILICIALLLKSRNQSK